MADSDDFEIPPVLAVDEFEGLQDAEKKLYKEVDGQYVIKLKGGYTDNEALKRAKNYEKENYNKANAELKRVKADKAKADKDLQEAVKKMEEFQKQASGTEEQVSKVQEGYINKVKELEERFNATEAKLRAKAEKSEKEAVCNDLSTLFTNKKTSLPMLRERISFEVVDGESKAVYLDDMGNKTDWTKEQFKQNLLDDKDLHDSLIGTRSTGSSASPSNNPRGSASVKPSQMDAPTIQKWMDEDPTGYMKALKAEQNSNKN